MDKKISVSLLDAVNLIHLAWREVSKETMANCFKHAGFFEIENEFDSDNELPIIEWLQKHTEDRESADIQRFIESEIRNRSDDFDFETYVTIIIDDCVISTESLTEEEII